MKLSTVLTSALAALATASPAITKHEASARSPSLLDIILHKLNLPSIPPKDFDELKQCMSVHRGFHADYSKAQDGVFSITNVDPTCCEKAKAIWSEVPPDNRCGEAVFNEPWG
ncbi:hypothetical protein INS49_014398 [Diaporthe citri]|uniref:uncharacterized protein n=1 Tax=Diaporthe citri TaxID=83186 RepID=UPI001C806A81|nr:uncharacterized protein INS49_014398 [Diaporthe citri]KAG6358514.1 hypothetical protein INS49_014398 [Diaporthe citri]